MKSQEKIEKNLNKNKNKPYQIVWDEVKASVEGNLYQ